MPNETEKKTKPKRVFSWNVTLLRYGIAILACGLLAFVWAWISGIFKPYEEVIKNYPWHMANEAQKNYFLLTNAFFGSGVIFLGVGLLVLAANGGVFEMLVYGIRRFGSLFQKDHNKIKFKTFYDYQVYRSGKPNTPCGFLVAVGIVYIAISMIFLMQYYANAPAV